MFVPTITTAKNRYFICNTTLRNFFSSLICVLFYKKFIIRKKIFLFVCQICVNKNQRPFQTTDFCLLPLGLFLHFRIIRSYILSLLLYFFWFIVHQLFVYIGSWFTVYHKFHIRLWRKQIAAI